MLEISEKMIKQIVNAQNYEYAKVHFNEMKITNLIIKCKENDDNYYIIASVSYHHHDNELEITINQHNEIVDYACDCPYCNSDSACSHIAFVLLAIQKLNPRIFPYRLDRYSFDRKMNALKKAKMSEQVKEAESELLKRIQEQRRQEELRRQALHEQYEKQRRLQLLQFSSSFIEEEQNYYLQDRMPIIGDNVHLSVNDFSEVYNRNTWSSQYAIRFKVGINKKYMVKNIDDFIDRIHKNTMFKYGKNLEFVHNYDAFDEMSLKWIKYLESNQSNLVQQYLYVDKDNIDEIYDLLLETSEDEISIIVGSSKSKVVLDLDQDNDLYRLSIGEQEVNLMVGKKYVYEMRDNLIKRIVDHQDGSLARLVFKLLNYKYLYLNDNSLKQFMSYFIMPNIDAITIKTNIELPNDNEESRLQLYADIDEDGLISIIIRCYLDNNQIIEGFDDQGLDIPRHLKLVEAYITKFASIIDHGGHVAYIPSDEAKTQDFLQNGFNFLRQYCEVFISDSLMRIVQRTPITMSVGVSIKNDLLHIDVDSVDITSEEIYEVLKAHKRKKKFHRLKDGRLIDLSDDSIDQMAQVLDELDVDIKDIKKGSSDIALYRSFHIKDMADDKDALQFDFRENYRDYLEKYQNDFKQPIEIPSHYHDILRDYQKEGYHWLKVMNRYHFGGILADDMGLGKTLQVIALLESEKASDRTSLIVTPSSLLYNWHDEFTKFSSSLSIACISGNAMQRKQLIKNWNQYDAIITSYDYLRRDLDEYRSCEFYYLVIDEAQYIKNPKTKNAYSVKHIKAMHHLALTGTPIENSLAELWSIFDFLMPGYLFNYNYFLNHYEKAIVSNHNEEKAIKLKQMVEPFILRRNKKDVLTELPDKVEITYPISFDEEEEKLYLANLASANKTLSEKLKVDKPDKIMILALLTRLRQLCCEPRVVYDNINQPSSKLKSCLELIQNLKENGQKVLLFSSFTSVLDLISHELVKQGVSYQLLTGDVKKEKRREMVKDFQEGLYDVFLISLKAGGTGLNLTRASAIIHYDPWWNLSAQNQASDRAYRIGQNQKVSVYKLIMRNSIEEKIAVLQEKKKNLSDTFVENNDGRITSMSFDEIISLFDVE